MSQIVAKIEITLDDQGTVGFIGTGQALTHKMVVYGLLELVKDIVRSAGDQKVQPATLRDLPARVIT